MKLVRNEAEVRAFADQWLGQRLVTFQTDANGQPVNTLYVEEGLSIAHELYLGAVLDRASQRVVFMVSTEGGVNIEEVAEKTPHLLHKMAIRSSNGGMPYQGRELAFKLGLKGDQIKQFAHIFVQMAKMFVEKDLALLEVNPLVVTKEGNLLCLDAKIVVDSNALYRQPALKAMQDPSQEEST